MVQIEVPSHLTR